MKRILKSCAIGLLLINIFFVAGCDDDDDDNSSPKMERSYALAEIADSGVSGTVTFTKQDDQTTLIVIEVSGTETGNSHPAHIHSGSASTGGPIVVDFTPVDGATGRSETTVTQLNDGTPITYEELIAYNGHVNVHRSAADLAVITQGDVGSNSTGSANNGGNGGNGGPVDGGY